MKTLSKGIISFLFLFSLLTVSCTENDSHKIINAEIEAGNVYKYEICTFGDEDGIRIIQQPRNYAVSKIVKDIVSGQVKTYYEYQPEEGFCGEEIIELQLINDNYSSNHPPHSSTITINLSVL